MTSEQSSKRRKTNHEPLLPSGNIRGAFELHNLLRFNQSGGLKIKAGIDEFKNFCTEIQQNEDLKERQIQLTVLKQYCDEQSSSNGEELDFPDLLSTWSFAAQSNNESVRSAVPAALSQFFRTISSELDFREFGLSLCQTLLKRDQVKLFDQGLSSPKSKEFLISPCLRLLTDIVSFDGGPMAGNIFSRRDYLLKRLDTLLEPPPSREGSDRRRPTVRSNGLRLLIALLKYLDVGSKEELIAHAKTLHACFKSLSVDAPPLIKDILSAVRQHLIDDSLSRDVKKRLLNSNNLGLLAALYDYEEDDSDEEASKFISVRETIHAFLVDICISTNVVSIPQTGWYPLGFSPEKNDVNEDDIIDLGLDSPYYSDDYSTSVPIKNTTLSTFLQKLKPANDTLQAELVMKIFEHTPELVADYFCRKPKLLTISKPDTDEWRGSFAFIFSVIGLPVPRNCGWHNALPQSAPPLSVIMESILPRAVDRATLSQCLKSEDDILTISAARMMIAVAHKLEETLSVFRRGSSELWNQAAIKLRDMVASRIPGHAEIVAAVRTQSQGHDQAKEALFECLATFTNHSNSYDSTSAIKDVLMRIQDTGIDDDQASLSRQLVSLMKVTGASKLIKWASVVDVLAFSAGHNEFREPCRQYLLPRLLEKAILRNEAAFWALMAAFTSYSASSAIEILQNLENCMTRIAKQPVKYLHQMEALGTFKTDETSLLACCLAEQWIHVTDSDASRHVGLFAIYFFSCLEAVGESSMALDKLRSTYSSSRPITRKIEKLKQGPPHVYIPDVSLQEEPTTTGGDQKATHAEPISLTSIFPPVFPIPSSLKGLTRWEKTDFESELHAPSTSRLASLIYCLSSPSQEIHLTAYQTLLTLTHQVSLSTYTEKDSLYLLLGELCETVRSHNTQTSSSSTTTTSTTPLPTLIPSLATFLLTIITSPSHTMYSTANHFLMLSPTWTPLTRLIPYWTNTILLSSPPSSSDTDPLASHTFTNSYLDVLTSGLLTSTDMDLYRKSNIFERLCSLYLAPATKRDTRRRILNVVYQGGVVVEGGADTLITRVGIRAWLSIVKGREDAGSELGRIIGALQVEIEQRCGKEYISGWEQRRAILTRKGGGCGDGGIGESA